jgi:hypothetical protein
MVGHALLAAGWSNLTPAAIYDLHLTNMIKKNPSIKLLLTKGFCHAARVVSHNEGACLLAQRLCPLRASLFSMRRLTTDHWPGGSLM